MTTYYVGSGGNNASAGTSWGARWLTITKAATTMVAGDTVYIGAGTYREMVTAGASGTAGNVISYIGDYTGANTDGVGGVVRITGSDNDQTATRTNCFVITSRSYITIRNFSMDTVTQRPVHLSGTGCDHITIDRCFIANGATSGSGCIEIDGANQAAITVTNSYLRNIAGNVCIAVIHSGTLNDVGHVFARCLLEAGHNGYGLYVGKVGGITVNGNIIRGGQRGVHIANALAVGQTVTVQNNIIAFSGIALNATASGEITEDYNDLFGCTTNRNNVSVGANSKTYPPLWESRWFFQLVNGSAAQQVVSLYDLSANSQLINVAGSGVTATDMRGQGAIGGTQDWGALEYDSTLKIKGGGAVSITSALGATL